MSSGGKSSTATSSTGIAPEFKPQLTRAVNLATDNLEAEYADPRRVVAGTEALRPGVDASEAVSRQALQGIDQNALNRQLMNTQGALQMQSQGNLGNARQARANAAALADQAVQLQQADLAMKGKGAEGLLNTGQLARSVQQQQLDAPHTALSRYFGYLGNVGQESKQTQPKGGK